MEGLQQIGARAACWYFANVMLYDGPRPTDGSERYRNFHRDYQTGQPTHPSTAGSTLCDYASLCLWESRVVQRFSRCVGRLYRFASLFP